jgi:nucleoside-diphosphate-sugar epimerase
MSTTPVLVVGATGSLGGKVVDELLERGKNVRALVRPTSDASSLESRGVQIARGDRPLWTVRAPRESHLNSGRQSGWPGLSPAPASSRRRGCP